MADSSTDLKSSRQDSGAPELFGDLPLWMVNVTDRCNAILVKETRQSLKSRGFVVTFMLVLTGAWLVSMWGILQQGPAIEYSSAGRWFFYAFYTVLVIATVLIVPFLTARSFQEERDLNTFELLQITSLSPRQIVWGKLLSAIVQLFIFYSAITPFIAFASLLQGFDAPVAAFLLIITFLISVFLSMFTLMLSTAAKNKAQQGGAAVATLAGLGWIMTFILFLVFDEVRRDRIAFDTVEFWAVLGASSLLYIGLFALFQQMAIAQLTFETDNRSTGIRVASIALLGLFWLCAVMLCAVLEIPRQEGFTVFLVILSGLYLLLFGLFFVTERDELSHRIRRSLRGGWRSTFFSPLLPGGTRGYLLVLCVLFGLWWIGMTFATLTVDYGNQKLFAVDWRDVLDKTLQTASMELSTWSAGARIVHMTICYVVIALGIAAIIGRLGRLFSNQFRPLHTRVIILLVIAAGIITPELLVISEAIKTPRTGYSLIYLFHPYQTITFLASTRSTTFQFPGGQIFSLQHVILWSLTICAIAAVVANAPALRLHSRDLKPTRV